MASLKIENPEKPRLEPDPVHHIRFTLSSCHVQSLERACSDLIKKAKKTKIVIKGPVRLPTKILRITTRKTPCGEGSKTWDRFQMRIHKRIVDLYTNIEFVKQVTCIDIDSVVKVDITVAQSE